ncbi:MAG TPA: amidohydrolase [Micromonosporaceae bacterium]|nr:amidohydrolase [Micromonosporaceae bacterium]
MTSALTRAPRRKRVRDDETESELQQPRSRAQGARSSAREPGRSRSRASDSGRAPHESAAQEVTRLWPEAPQGVDPLPGQLDRWLADNGADLIAVRRQIHSHPELSGQEFETAALVERRLIDAGLKPRLLSTRNGVICDIGTGDRVIALRADLDALPLPDTKNVPYRSTVPNVCHACGHDVHTTILLGAGLALARLAEQGELPGRVRLIFQPSEENVPSGAPQVIEEGGLEDVAAIFALHCFPQLPAGLVGVRSGPLTAATDLVEITLSGRGGHTARPHLTEDLVHALGRVVVDVPALLARRTDPRAAVTMVFGAVRAGEAANTIPIQGHLRGTVRVLSREVWRELPHLVPQLVRDAVAGTGVEADINYVRGVPPVVNDRVATAIMAAAAAAALGPDRVVDAEVSMGGEDFAFYVDEVPGSMIRLGVGKPGATEKVDIHQSRFDIDEKAIGYGVRVFVHAALAALSAGSL